MSITAEKSPREWTSEQLSFSDKDMQGIEKLHNDALVITLKIATWEVKRVLIDPGSFSEIMYQNLYRSPNIPFEDIIPVNSPISNYSGEAIWPVGHVGLLVRITTMEFLIVDIKALYNVIMGRTWLVKSKQ